MADGGASTFIMLITGLLISSSVSALLISEWSSTAKVAQVQQRGAQLNSELDIEFAGDPMMVDFDDSTLPETITFYIQNSGMHPMDESKMTVVVDGVEPISVSVSLVGTPTPSSWVPNELAMIVVEYNPASGYSDGDDVALYAIATSEVIGGLSSSASMSIEVRLS